MELPPGAPVGPFPHDFSPGHIREGLERSLRLLRTDHLDLLQLHISPSLETIRAEGAVETLQTLRDEGKVRFIGSSSTIPNLWDHLELDVFDAFQIPYSALDREHEAAITEASGRDAGVIIRGGVAKGGPRPDRPQFRNVWEAWEAAKLDELLEEGQSRVEFVLRFTLGHPGLSTIIVGTASVDHLRDNVAKALQGPLPLMCTGKQGSASTPPAHPRRNGARNGNPATAPHCPLPPSPAAEPARLRHHISDPRGCPGHMRWERRGLAGEPLALQPAGGSAGVISVWVKLSPLYSKGSPVALARA